MSSLKADRRGKDGRLSLFAHMLLSCSFQQPPLCSLAFKALWGGWVFSPPALKWFGLLPLGLVGTKNGANATLQTSKAKNWRETDFKVYAWAPGGSIS